MALRDRDLYRKRLINAYRKLNAVSHGTLDRYLGTCYTVTVQDKDPGYMLGFLVFGDHSRNIFTPVFVTGSA